MKRLSERLAFQDSLVLSTFYSASPGSNGECELAVRYLKKKTSLWLWDDQWGAEEMLALPPKARWREIVKAVLPDERFCSAITVHEVRIFRDASPLGQVLALAWADDGEYKDAVNLMLRLSDEILLSVSNRRGGLCDRSWLAMLSAVTQRMEDLDVDVSELPETLIPDGDTVKSVRTCFFAELRSIAKRKDEEQAQIDALLAPFVTAIESITNEWTKDKPRSRYSGSGSMLPPFGLTRFRTYLREHVIAHGSLPSGVHTIPDGPDLFNKPGQAFQVDFEALRTAPQQQTV